ncbi:cuticle protein CP14.6 [Drosophila virilis]|uniref:Uncharacterized protein n=1 Tax=Drosophila virilis TaxID=7244 RepID=B4LHF5_DROVI|nr:cuticle protein CP14.6 [Drosophila virilis]EDW68485.1 uncharacterized protein Dvir_GJ12742 [Drosophila virilis]
MKCAVVFLCLCLALSAAAPANDATIVSQSSDVQPDGYKLELETSDGTKRTEEGILKNPGTDNEALAVKGAFSYVGDDGVTYSVSYVADENGFQPEGAHIPRA